MLIAARFVGNVSFELLVITNGIFNDMDMKISESFYSEIDKINEENVFATIHNNVDGDSGGNLSGSGDDGDGDSDDNDDDDDDEGLQW